MMRSNPVATAALALALSAGGASAQSCGDLAEMLARQYGLEAAPPANLPDQAPLGSPDELPQGEVTAPGAPVTTDDLAQSGGVIEPPATGDAAVIEPPATGATMPTAPSVVPDPPTPLADPALQTQLEAVLAAARAAAEDGDEAECTQRLQEAQGLVEDLPRN